MASDETAHPARFAQLAGVQTRRQPTGRAAGVHARVVMETLGHSQIGLTMDTYSHVMPSLQRDAADLMDAVLAGA